jgi:hypothetical protein
MRVINYDASRVTCLFPLEEVIPLSGIDDREMIASVSSRYKFLKSPDLAKENIAKDGFKFGSGQFSFQSSVFRVNEFSIFRDGLVVNAATTDGSEAFLDDVISYMKSAFSFRDFETPPRRYFQSQIIVEFDRSPENLIKSLNKIATAISFPLEQIYGMEIPMRFARLDFEFDKILKPTPASAVVQRFIIERRQGIPFAKERYFCAAPVRTAEHEKVLLEIERFID